MKAVAILSPIGLQTKPIADGIIGCHWVKSLQTGAVYVVDWWTNPDLSKVEDCDTIKNLTASATLPAECVQAFGEGKAVVIHGLDSIESALSAFGMVYCDAEGNLN